MSRVDFPYDTESDHPQYKWNEMEFFIRMLHQNRIGAGLYEDEAGWEISLDPSVSLNTIAYGGADFKNTAKPISGKFEKDEKGEIRNVWIYIRADGSEFYVDYSARPKYNNYLHGWYKDNGDRCIAFVNPYAPPKYRVIIMDSFNSTFEYDQYVPDSGGQVVYNSIQEGVYFSKDDEVIELMPGKYRFEMRGGKGGNGGKVKGEKYLFPNYDAGTATDSFTGSGGEGSVAKTYTFKIVIHNKVTLRAWVGRNGSNGEDSKPAGQIVLPGMHNEKILISSAGGGSSGMDTYILFTDGVLLFEAIGGAGGGGAYIIASERRQIGKTNAPAPNPNYDVMRSWQCSGPGGGGAGSSATNYSNEGQVENIGYYTTTTPGPQGGSNQPAPAKGGGLDAGGEGSVGTESTEIKYERPVFNYDVLLRGKNGQNRGNLRRRNGGDSGTVNGITALGGNTDVTSDVSGFLTIYRTGGV